MNTDFNSLLNIVASTGGGIVLAVVVRSLISTWNLKIRRKTKVKEALELVSTTFKNRHTLSKNTAEIERALDLSIPSNELYVSQLKEIEGLVKKIDLERIREILLNVSTHNDQEVMNELEKLTADIAATNEAMNHLELSEPIVRVRDDQ